MAPRALVLVLAALAVAPGCAGVFVGLRQVDAEYSAEQISTNAISSGKPSASTALVLRRNALDERFEDEPREVIDVLQKLCCERHARDVAFAISELSFLTAVDEEASDLYLTAACFAWFTLFDDSLGPELGRLDPRLRLCCDLYNRSIVEAFDDEDGDIVLQPGLRSMEGGTVDLDVDMRSVEFDLTRLPRFLPASHYAVVGIQNRHRRAGLGAPLIAVPSKDAAGPENTKEALSRPTCAGATFLLRLEGGLDQFVAGSLTGTQELHQPAVETEFKVGETSMPLEFDLTATIAYFVQGSRLLEFELPSFLGSKDDYSGIYAPTPYARGRIPVVLVHGTNSSLPRWAGMLNDLFADPALRDRIQVWFFTYPSGVPIGISADLLRQALIDMRHRCDPQGTDPALNSVVVIGHSQGGLLTRQLVVEDSEQALWNSLFTKPIDELKLDASSRELAQRVFFSKPLSCVTRAIYIATPHLGSFQADRWYTRIASGLITLPSNVITVASDLVLHNRDAVQKGMEGRTTSSLDGMRSDNPYLLALAKLHVAKGVHQHCICAIDGDDEPPEGDDGVVAYSSANLAGADSTFLVRHDHSCQSDPLVINEVARILREHIAAYDAALSGLAPAP